ncbi:MAG: TlpA family protein disulfide reductase [Sulfurovum sp.]|nr:TlpA family protein disulfide reductase [Sulfurovum sp.]NNJ45256.1 TlpA family protein disulfide reductase [Sulfurovum sp.]
MHKIGAVLLLILLIIIIIFIGGEDEKPEVSSIPTENTTEIFSEKESPQQEDKRFKLGKKQDDLANTLPQTEFSTPETNISVPKKAPEVFTLTHTKSVSHKVTVSDRTVIFQNTTQPIVIVNLFATWCPPCIGEIPYLNDLQDKHKKELFVVGVLTHDSIVQTELETFMAKHPVNYFISSGTTNDAFANLLATTLHLPKNFSIPLTVIYLEGEYFTHYEGVVPVEMIEYDIQQAKKQLKTR